VHTIFARRLIYAIILRGARERAAPEQSPWPVRAQNLSSYDRNAAFMSSQPHDSGIHAVKASTDGANGINVRFRRASRPLLVSGKRSSARDQAALSARSVTVSR
jgi:hypothetical protein